MEKTIPDEILKAVTAQGFDDLVLSLLPRYHYKHYRAFDVANEFYFNAFGCLRYTDLNSYKAAKSKRESQRKKLTKLTITNI